MPDCDRSGLRRKKSPSSVWIYFSDGNLASAFVARGSAVWRGQDRDRWRAKPPDDGFSAGVLTPCFCAPRFGTEPKIPWSLRSAAE
jgi:hypothetical protein